MVIYSEWRKLAFLRLGDEVWTPIDGSNGIYDVIYFNGQFYAITFGGKLLIVDISSPHPKTMEFAEPAEGIYTCGQLYLVGSEGELFVLAQHVYEGEDDEATLNLIRETYGGGYEGNDGEVVHGVLNHIWETDGLDVYKFSFDDKKWTQVKGSLDNRALFVGFNDSFTIFPSSHLVCEPNSIYFTDVSLMEGGAGHDMGVFRMETKELDEHYVGPDIISCVCAPLWICPYS